VAALERILAVDGDVESSFPAKLMVAS
jgi:hypothetical protein